MEKKKDLVLSFVHKENACFRCTQNHHVKSLLLQYLVISVASFTSTELVAQNLASTTKWIVCVDLFADVIISCQIWELLVCCMPSEKWIAYLCFTSIYIFFHIF